MQLLLPKMDQTQSQSVEHGRKLLAGIPKPYLVSKHIQSWTTFQRLLKMFGESQAPISWYFHMHWSTSAFGSLYVEYLSMTVWFLKLRNWNTTLLFSCEVIICRPKLRVHIFSKQFGLQKLIIDKKARWIILHIYKHKYIYQHEIGVLETVTKNSSLRVHSICPNQLTT